MERTVEIITAGCFYQTNVIGRCISIGIGQRPTLECVACADGIGNKGYLIKLEATVGADQIVFVCDQVSRYAPVVSDVVFFCLPNSFENDLLVLRSVLGVVFALVAENEVLACFADQNVIYNNSPAHKLITSASGLFKSCISIVGVGRRRALGQSAIFKIFIHQRINNGNVVAITGVGERLLLCCRNNRFLGIVVRIYK